jgi:hypothetical protein
MKKCLIDIKLLINFYDFQMFVCMCLGVFSNTSGWILCIQLKIFWESELNGGWKFVDELDKQIPHYDAHISAYDA